jgi:hypothetical protein
MPFCTNAQAAASSALDGGSQKGWLYVMAAPQYAIAHAGSVFATSLKRARARAYQKLCRRASARSKSGATVGEQEMSMCTRPNPSSCAECGCSCCLRCTKKLSANPPAAHSKKVRNFMATLPRSQSATPERVTSRSASVSASRERRRAAGAPCKTTTHSEFRYPACRRHARSHATTARPSIGSRSVLCGGGKSRLLPSLINTIPLMEEVPLDGVAWTY